MREVRLGPGLRALLDAVVVAAVLCGVLVGATELRIAARWWPYWPAVAAAAVCGGAALGGAARVHGRIAVRRLAARPHRPER